MESPKKNPQRIRTRYTKEFKLEAVRLLRLGQKPAAELALELGIRRNQLYKWAEELSRKDGDEALAFNYYPTLRHGVRSCLLPFPD